MRWVGLTVGVAVATLCVAAPAQALGLSTVCDLPAGCLVGPSLLTNCEIVGVGGFPPQPTIDEGCIPGGPREDPQSPPEDASVSNSTSGSNEPG
jgi:hypothetical protein